MFEEQNRIVENSFVEEQSRTVASRFVVAVVSRFVVAVVSRFAALEVVHRTVVVAKQDGTKITNKIIR